MTMQQRLDLRQSQSLVMTPQLQQAIKLLQMSNIEVQDFLAREIEANPLLEQPEGDGDEIPAAEAADDAPLTATSATPEADVFAHDAPLDTDFDNLWANEAGRGGHGLATDEEGDWLERHAERPSLRDHLLRQVQCDLTDPIERMIGAALIDLLDDNGYLPADLDLARTQLGATPQQFETVINALQRFDPVGIGARSLAECLALQLRERNRLDPAMVRLLEHLDCVAARDIKKLQQFCGVDAEDISDMLAEIRRLNPRPAQAFQSDAAQTLIPDALLRPLAGGGWQVELNPESLPRALANESYYTRIAAKARHKTEKDYLQERWQHANWLIKALHQRAMTILKVTSEIVRHQDNFFIYGVGHLRPLTLKQVAAAVGMHESTVSRVTNGKYLATPRGIFELKYFFTNALANREGGDAHAATAVRHRIKALIATEQPGKALADDAIADQLRQDGIVIARRTVAKYREAMNIPPSSTRRRTSKG